MVHNICFELVGIRMPDETTRLEAAIQEFGPAYAFTKTSWFVESELDNHEISERLLPLLRPRDRLIVSRVHKDWVGLNIGDPEREWLGSRNFSGVEDPPLFRR